MLSNASQKPRQNEKKKLKGTLDFSLIFCLDDKVSILIILGGSRNITAWGVLMYINMWLNDPQ